MVGEPLFKPGDVCGEAYRIEQMLTRELFAETYLAARRAKRERALITCSRLQHMEGGPPPERLFRKELEKLRKVGPRHAPALLNAGVDAGVYWIATRHVEAPTVAELNHKNADQSRVWLVGDTLSAVLDLAAVLSGARQVGVLHGDLSPSRVLVDGLPMEHVLLVTGLGHADLFRLDARTARTSPRYRSPEQLAGERIDERSDIYALGMLLYGWLAGAPPFAEREPLETEQLITLAEHSLPRPLTEMGVARPVWELVAAMIQKDPGMRFQSWLDFIDVLSPFLEDVMLDVMLETAARKAARKKDPEPREEPSAAPSDAIRASGVRKKRSDKSKAAGSPSSRRNSDAPRSTPRVPVAPEAPETDEVVPVTLPSVVADAVQARGSSSLDEGSEPEAPKDPNEPEAPKDLKDPEDPEDPEEPDEPPPNASSGGADAPSASGSSSRPASGSSSHPSSRPSSRRKRAPRKARGAALGLAALFVGGLLGSLLSSSGGGPRLQSLAHGAHLHFYPFALVYRLLEAPGPSAAPRASAAPKPARSATARPAKKDICADVYCFKDL